MFRIRLLLALFVLALVASGLTAFPLVWELRLLDRWFGREAGSAERFPGWLGGSRMCRQGLEASGRDYPFLAYGTDWLAFAHLVIAIAFLGPIKDPVKNIWVVEFGMIACVLVIPLAIVCGQIRGIPWWWRLIDCTFGVFGLVPLALARQMIRDRLLGGAR